MDDMDDILHNSLFPPKCYYYPKSGFTTRDKYEIHVVRIHPRKPGYPGPADIKFYHLKEQGMVWEQIKSKIDSMTLHHSHSNIH